MISDGKPGHLNQSLGLAEAIARLRGEQQPTEIFTATHLSFWQCIGVFAGQTPALAKLPEHIDLVIGAGHRCHLTILTAAKHWRATSIVLMKPSLPMSCFDYCVLPRHDDVKASERVLISEGAMNRVSYQGQTKNRSMILLGGPSPHFDWDEGFILAQLQTIFDDQPERPWQLLTSRRTPATFVQALQAKPWPIEIIEPGDIPGDWLAKAYPSFEYCWVSPDSVSMVYEALTAKAKVSVLDLPATLKKGKPSRVAQALHNLVEADYVGRFTESGRGGASINKPTAPFMNQADNCAQQLQERGVVKQ